MPKENPSKRMLNAEQSLREQSDCLIISNCPFPKNVMSLNIEVTRFKILKKYAVQVRDRSCENSVVARINKKMFLHESQTSICKRNEKSGDEKIRNKRTF